MTTFIALPVGCGDSFICEDEKEIILMDGGLGIKREGQVLKKFVREAVIDVAICSHNDADHARGLLALFDPSNKLQLKKLILPLEYAKFQRNDNSSDDILFRELLVFFTIDFSNKITHSDFLELKQAAINQKAKLQKDFDYYVHGLNERETDFWDLLRKNIQNKNRFSNFGEAKRTRKDILFSRHSLGYMLCLYSILQEKKGAKLEKLQRLRLQIVSRAFFLKKNIQRLLTQALKASSEINIEFYEFLEKGNPNAWKNLSSSLLIPMNCKPSTTISTSSKLSYVANLVLSEDNRRSLIFYKSIDCGKTGVLFCADSDLRSLPDFNALNFPIPESIVATAPHHGSDHNSRAYSVVDGIFGNVFWVRSDGIKRTKRNKTRPCSKFISEVQKDCTCRLGKEVTLVFNGVQWIPKNGICCRCNRHSSVCI